MQSSTHSYSLSCSKTHEFLRDQHLIRCCASRGGTQNALVNCIACLADGLEDQEEEIDENGSEEGLATAEDHDSDGGQLRPPEGPTASQSADNLDIPELTTESYDEDPEVSHSHRIEGRTLQYLVSEYQFQHHIGLETIIFAWQNVF